MSTSIISLDQNFNANDVDIMVFESCALFSPSSLGGIEHMVPRPEFKNDKVQEWQELTLNKYSKISRA